MVREKAYAKTNLGLAVLGRREDGYHDIDTVMQSVSLHDVIILEKADRITISCNDASIPVDWRNTAYKAASAFFEETCPENCGVSIAIEKNIPQKAGLGGGSSDAAAVLRGLNKLYGANYGTDKLRQLGLKVGSDVPFSITGGTCRVRGRGELLEPLNPLKDLWVVIAMPDETVETAWAYSLFNENDFNLNPDMDTVADAIRDNDIERLALGIENVFERKVTPFKPSIANAVRDILSTEALAASMTGSGAGVFGLYGTRARAMAAEKELGKIYDVFLCRTTGEVT